MWILPSSLRWVVWLTRSGTYLFTSQTCVSSYQYKMYFYKWQWEDTNSSEQSVFSALSSVSHFNEKRKERRKSREGRLIAVEYLWDDAVSLLKIQPAADCYVGHSFRAVSCICFPHPKQVQLYLSRQIFFLFCMKKVLFGESNHSTHLLSCSLWVR